MLPDEEREILLHLVEQKKQGHDRCFGVLVGVWGASRNLARMGSRDHSCLGGQWEVLRCFCTVFVNDPFCCEWRGCEKLCGGWRGLAWYKRCAPFQVFSLAGMTVVSSIPILLFSILRHTHGRGTSSTPPKVIFYGREKSSKGGMQKYQCRFFVL